MFDHDEIRVVSARACDSMEGSMQTRRGDAGGTARRVWVAAGMSATMVCVAGLAVQAATVVWDGGAGDGKWSSNANWSDDANGVNANDTASFADAATGVNTMDKTSPFTLTALVYTNTTGTHTTDLQGNQLNVTTLKVGENVSSASAVIRNGTYRFGGSAYAYVGYRSAGTTATGTLVIGSSTTTTKVDASNTTTRIYVGDSGGEGTLDLSNATFDSAGAKRLLTTELHLGRASGYLRTGRIVLPESDKLTNVTATSQFTLGLGGGTGRLGSAADPDRLPDGVCLQLGSSAANRCTTLIARGGWSNPGTGRLTMGSNSTFTLWAGEFKVGWSDTGGKTTGLLDLRNATIGNGGTLDVNDWQVGYGATTGKVLFGASSGSLSNLYINTVFVLGKNSAGPVGRMGSGSDGEGDMPVGMNLRIGVSTSSRASVEVGRDGDAPGSNGKMSLGSNSTFEAYVSDFFVGYPLAGYHVSYGVLDLRSGTLKGGGMDVSNILRVGAGAGSGYGKLYLGPSPSDTVIAQSPVVQVGQASGGSGWLELFGTVFRINGSTASNLLIRTTGTNVVHVQGRSAGFIITNATAGILQIDNGGRMRIDFDAAPDATYGQGDIYWGLRQAGDQRTAWQALNNSGGDSLPNTADDKLAWTKPGLSAKVGINYDTAGNFTYVGYQIPIRGTLILMH